MPIKARWPESGSQQAVDVLLEIAFGTHSDDLAGDLAIFEKEERWNGADAIFSGQRLLFINIDFANADTAIVLPGKFIQQGADHFAWTAPLGPKIDDHGTGDAEDLFREIGLG
jgi:hypothetical protein